MHQIFHYYQTRKSRYEILLRLTYFTFKSPNIYNSLDMKGLNQRAWHLLLLSDEIFEVSLTNTLDV